MESRKYSLETIKKQIENIYKDGFIAGDEFMEVYSLLYDLCVESPNTLISEIEINVKETVADRQKLFCEYTLSLIKNMIFDHVKQSYAKIYMVRNNEFLKTYFEMWFKFKGSTNIVYNVCMAITSRISRLEVDRSLKSSYNIKLIANNIWNSLIYESLQDKIFTLLFECIQEERESKSNHSQIINNFLKFICELKCDEDFDNGEDLFIKNNKNLIKYIEGYKDHSAKYYKDKLEKLKTQSDNIMSLVNFVSPIYQQEFNRFQMLKDSIYLEEIIKSLDSVLIEPYIQDFVNYLFLTIKSNHFEDVKKLFIIVSKTPAGFNKFKETFKEHINTNVSIIIKEYPKISPKYSIINVLATKYLEFYSTIRDHFENLYELKKTLNIVYTNIISNSETDKNCDISRLLAKTFDSILLYKNPKNENISNYSLSGEEIKIFVLFTNFVKNKEYFFEHYSRYLAQRLLKVNFKSLELELDYINRFYKTLIQLSDPLDEYHQTICFIANSPVVVHPLNPKVKFYHGELKNLILEEPLKNMNKMIDDYKLSEGFSEKLNNPLFKALLCNVQFWKNLIKMENKGIEKRMKLPIYLKDYDDKVQFNFSKENANKILILLPEESTVQIKCCINKKTFSIYSNVCHASVMLLFQDGKTDFITVQSIKKKLNLEGKDLNITLNELNNSSLIILRNNNKNLPLEFNKTIPLTTKVYLNKNFTKDSSEINLLSNRVKMLDIMKTKKRTQEVSKEILKESYKSIIMKVLKEAETLCRKELLKRVNNLTNVSFEWHQDVFESAIEFLKEKHFMIEKECQENIQYNYVP